MQSQGMNTAPQTTTELQSRDLFLLTSLYQSPSLPRATCQMAHVIFSNLNDILLLYPYGLVLIFALFR